MHQEQEWFSTWFDSPYYHILYGHRDEQEARDFLDRLIALPFFQQAHDVADVCCGKGRHAAYLHQRGFEVTGYDLSSASIHYCNSIAGAGMRFAVHDIREPLPHHGFDVVLNLFTSFGYFNIDQDHQVAFENMCHALNENGRFIIDFLNPEQIKKNLIGKEVVIKGGIRFEIERTIEHHRLIKKIGFTHEGKRFDFEENVALISLADFQRYLASCGMETELLFGNYELHPYDPSASPRMILIAKHT